MDLSHTTRRADTRAAAEKRGVKLSTFTGGLSAWLGGVAFCVGFGLAAPTWVALPLTVGSAAAAGVSRALVRRTGRAADRPAASG